MSTAFVLYNGKFVHRELRLFEDVGNQVASIDIDCMCGQLEDDL